MFDVSTSLQARWRRGEPVVVGSLAREFELQWGPHGFLERFGAEQVNMIDCRDGKSVHWLTLAHFFAGYTKPWTRAKCPDTFRRMMLKLKDWPPNTDFRDKMPEYFDDLMEALPFPQYTHRDGVLNLARHFPPDCVPPDLGPKMYNGFGQKHAWRGMDPAVAKVGTTHSLRHAPSLPPLPSPPPRPFPSLPRPPRPSPPHPSPPHPSSSPPAPLPRSLPP